MSLKWMTQSTFCPLFWFNKSDWSRWKRPLMYKDCLVREGRTQSLDVTIMRVLGFYWGNAAESSLGEGNCSGARRSTEQSIQVFPHNPPSESFNESTWRFGKKTSLSESQPFAPRSALVWEIPPRRREREERRSFTWRLANCWTWDFYGQSNPVKIPQVAFLRWSAWGKAVCIQ